MVALITKLRKESIMTLIYLIKLLKPKQNLGIKLVLKILIKGTLKGLRITNFMIPQSKLFLRQESQHSLRMLSLGGEMRLETLSLKRRKFFQLLLLLLTMCKFYSCH